MIEKPQLGPGGKRADLLEQIFIRGLNKAGAPAQIMMREDDSTEKTHPSPQREDSAEAGPPANRKNRNSSVYLYLLILFGAAFLMLLLAYFVQQRSSASTVSDLNNSMDLSREELLSEIKDLEKQCAALSEQNTALENINSALVQELDRLNGELAQWQTPLITGVTADRVGAAAARSTNVSRETEG